MVGTWGVVAHVQTDKQEGREGKGRGRGRVKEVEKNKEGGCVWLDRRKTGGERERQGHTQTERTSKK